MIISQYAFLVILNAVKDLPFPVYKQGDPSQELRMTLRLLFRICLMHVLAKQIDDEAVPEIALWQKKLFILDC